MHSINKKITAPNSTFAASKFAFMKRIIGMMLLSLPLIAAAQTEINIKDTTWKSLYRETPEKRHALVHTKLDVKFDFKNSYMYGKEWLTLKPYFYSTDSVVLDAKGMIISMVAMISGNKKIPLAYRYDSAQLFIRTDRVYKKEEKFTLYFEYTSRPNELNVKGSQAITDAKGLYFINPTGEDKTKPTQIWTQGETEAGSAWMITIDKPNQKTTQELSMTVPERFVTLSNGILSSQKKNTDGTRTDTWKMDLPHAPYLFFMGAGEYSIIKDTYKGKEVSYYVEKEYAPYARGIFGLTPEMISFYSKITGVDYPWPKYAQIVGRDFVSGAMENTTATLHQESAYQNARELKDGNRWEETIAHELFHHWFGDLVTTESWSNITLNESFANYGEYLWLEYKYGKDKADQHNYENMMQYAMSGSDQKNLVRHYYESREDVFDLVSYQKGGRILHMLRNHIGDSAFFKGIQLYLAQNKYKSAEAPQLRLAFEEVTGKDLNWFFNQWYYGNGHPKLKINYEYDDAAGLAKVIVSQTQKTDKVFRLPVAVDIYENGKRTRHERWLENKNDTLVFSYKSKPELINVDADKVLLTEKTDNKSAENFIAQWKNARNYLDRYEALQYFSKKNLPELALGLQDPYEGIRIFTIQKAGSSMIKHDSSVIRRISEIALSKKTGKLKAAAIQFLVKKGDKSYLGIYEKNVNDSSYSVSGAAMKGLMEIYPDSALSYARKFSKDARGALGQQVKETMMKQGDESDFEIVSGLFNEGGLSEEKFSMLKPYVSYLKKVKDKSKLKKGIDDIIQFRNQVPSQYREYTDVMFEQQLTELGKSNDEEIRGYLEEHWWK
jgi:aminopeptidase N